MKFIDLKTGQHTLEEHEEAVNSLLEEGYIYVGNTFGNPKFYHPSDKSKEDKKVKYLVLSLIAFSIFLIFNSYYRMFLYIGRFGFTNLRLQVILFLFMEIILFGFIIKKIIRGAKKDGMVFLIIMTITYVINLYVCNDWFIGILEKIWK